MIKLAALGQTPNRPLSCIDPIKCPTPNWQGFKNSLQSITSDSIHTKMRIKTQTYNTFSLALVFQKCLPNIQIYSSLKTGRPVLLDCGVEGKQRTIVPLMADDYWNKELQSESVYDLSKKNNWIELWITGLDSEIASPGNQVPLNLNDFFYENDKMKRCSVMKNKNCLYPFFVGIVEGKFDLDCYAHHIKDNTPSN